MLPENERRQAKLALHPNGKLPIFSRCCCRFLTPGIHMFLIRQHYTSPNASRQAELDQAARANAACGLFAGIGIVDGTRRRLTFRDLFDYAHRTFPNEVCVVANSDISFDHTLSLVIPRVLPHVLIALSRWENESGPVMGGHVIDEEDGKLFSQTQDVWIFRGGALPSFRSDQQLGMLACETRLAYEAAAAGVVILNPALSIRTRHHHKSNIRTYTKKDICKGPRYLARITTIDAPIAEGYIIDPSRRPKRRVVRLDGSADAFARQIAEPPRMFGSYRISLRSPIYFRQRSA